MAVTLVKSPIHALEKIRAAVEASETLGRIGQAKIVYNHLKRQGLSDEEAFKNALFEGRDVLDYDRRGSKMYAMTRFFVFLNPAIQATERSQRVLFGAPFNAAVEAYKRGGYAALDGATKSMLADGIKDWGMIALGTVATMAYYAYSADDPVYQRMSNYMRRRYYVFGAGVDKDGRQNVITFPKPFDHAGGIFGAIEAGMDGLRRGDPQTWTHVREALLDGFIPHQFSSLQEFLTGNPHIKTAYEAFTNKSLGFDGSKARPIVPMNMEKLNPELQYNGTTSFIAKKFGQWFGVSPLMADHVLNGIGGTAAKDTSHMVTAMFDNQPNVTMKDAMTRMFFGALYREARGGGTAGHDAMDLMAPNNGSYAVAANSYKYNLEHGDEDQAEALYRNANDTAKTLMTLRAGQRFDPATRQLHPLERTASMGKILSDVTRDLASSHLLQATRHYKKGEEKKFLQVDAPSARAITNTVGAWLAEESRNGLTIAGEPGYEHFPVVDTKPRLEAIRELDPDVATKIEKRIRKAHILPADTVARNWPEAKRRLLQDQDHARIGTLRFAH